VFAAPPVVATEVFARIPESLYSRGRRHGILEGPSFDREGNLWVTNITLGQVLRVSPSGDVTLVAEYDGEPNGLKVHKDGRIHIADHKQGLMLLDPTTGKVSARCSTDRATSASRA
jgi:gluconolactonase